MKFSRSWTIIIIVIVFQSPSWKSVARHVQLQFCIVHHGALVWRVFRKDFFSSSFLLPIRGVRPIWPTTDYGRLNKVFFQQYTKFFGRSSIFVVVPKIQQTTKMLVTCQSFVDLFLFGLVWQYSSVQTKYNKGRFKVMATYLQQ